MRPMGGSVYFLGVFVVGFIIVSILVSPFFIIPAVVVALVALFSAPLLAAISRGGQEGAKTGTPTTGEASYEPVAQPDERRI